MKPVLSRYVDLRLKFTQGSEVVSSLKPPHRLPDRLTGWFP